MQQPPHKKRKISPPPSSSWSLLSSPHRKRKISPPPSSSWSLLSSLPDEMVLSCLARVSRSDHVALSLVSRTYRSLVASPELYRMRSVLGCAENCLYVCLLAPPDPTPRWFILTRGRTLLRLPSPTPSVHPTEGFSVVAMDWSMYIIGGRRKGKITSNVWRLDCRTHTWHRAPSMKLSRAPAAAGVVDGKIYVFGGCGLRNRKSPNWGEVFDPNTQTWDSLPSLPDERQRYRYIHDSIVVNEDKVYAVDIDENAFYYSPKEGKWGRGNTLPRRSYIRDWCVIDGLIYCIDHYGCLCWCEPEQLEGTEPEEMYWREMKGLASLQEALYNSSLVHLDSRYDIDLIDLLPRAKLSNSGDNIVLFWDVIKGDDYHREIWFAEISLERRRGRQGQLEVWGNIEWSNAVMTVNPFLDRYKVLHSVSVTL